MTTIVRMHKLARMDLSHMLTSTQAADALGVDRATLTRYATSGALPTAYKLPGQTGARLFNPVDVEAFHVNRTAMTAVPKNPLQPPKVPQRCATTTAPLSGAGGAESGREHGYTGHAPAPANP